jgi:hypothetical protein
MPDKTLADLEEMLDPRYDGIPGSEMYELGAWEQDDIDLHNKNLQQVLDQEYEEMKALCGMC